MNESPQPSREEIAREPRHSRSSVSSGCVRGTLCAVPEILDRQPLCGVPKASLCQVSPSKVRGEK